MTTQAVWVLEWKGPSNNPWPSAKTQEIELGKWWEGMSLIIVEILTDRTDAIHKGQKGLCPQQHRYVIGAYHIPKARSCRWINSERVTIMSTTECQDMSSWTLAETLASLGLECDVYEVFGNQSQDIRVWKWLSNPKPQWWIMPHILFVILV